MQLTWSAAPFLKSSKKFVTPGEVLLRRTVVGCDRRFNNLNRPISSLESDLWLHSTRTMTSAKVVEMSVTTTDSVSPSQDYCHPDDQTTRSNVIPTPPSYSPPSFDTVHDDFFFYIRLHSRKVTNHPYGFIFNLLHLNISMYNLHTVLNTFLKVLTRRICSVIKNFFSWWSLPFCDFNVWFRGDIVRRN